MAYENSFLHITVGSIRAQMRAMSAQMHALDQALELFEAQVASQPEEEPVPAETAKHPNGKYSDKPHCPNCTAVLIDDNEITAMGAARKQYACPSCDYHGPL